MDIDTIVQSGAQLFQNRLDTNRDGKVDAEDIASALMSLLGNDQGQLSLSSIVSSMQSGGGSDLAALAASWLGKGANAPVSGHQLEQMFGHDKIAAFAKQLGISESTALGGLQEAVPDMFDKASPDGTLMDLGEQLLNGVGGVSGAIDAVGRLLGGKKSS
ncbi:MAG: YidB family protein [Gammaproteobacteria bacterium]